MLTDVRAWSARRLNLQLQTLDQTATSLLFSGTLKGEFECCSVHVVLIRRLLGLQQKVRTAFQGVGCESSLRGIAGHVASPRSLIPWACWALAFDYGMPRGVLFSCVTGIFFCVSPVSFYSLRHNNLERRPLASRPLLARRLPGFEPSFITLSVWAAEGAPFRVGFTPLGLRHGLRPSRVSAFIQTYLSFHLKCRSRFTPFRFQGFGLGPLSLGFRSGFSLFRAPDWVYFF